MRSGERLPGDQAEVVFSDESVEWIADNLNPTNQDAVIDTIVSLFQNPAGKHPLSNTSSTKLAGFNTINAGDGVELRVVFRSSAVNGVGLIEIVAIGPRDGSAVYDMAHALIRSGKLTSEEAAQIWEVVEMLDLTRSRLGLEDWDYFEGAAPEGLVKAAVAAGVLDEATARLLTITELTAAMTEGWGADGAPDVDAGLAAALRLVGNSARPDRILTSRPEARCGALMPRSKRRCIRIAGHAGAHRSAR